jgi:GT2 family glycosyltransferase
MTATIAAVVVRYRGGDEVSRCLRSLGDHGGSRLAEIALVDSGSGDDGAARLAIDFPQVRVLELDVNRSFAWAANHGATATSAPYLLLLNPDTEVLPGSVDAMAELLDSRPQAAAAVPLLEGMDGSSQHRWQLRCLPGALRLARGLPGAPAFPGLPPSSAVQVEQPAAAAWLVRRAAWEAVGGLDPGFAPAWWEDVDFCARLDRSLQRDAELLSEGFWVVPTARVRHVGGSSLGSLSEDEFLTVFYRNLLRYARRHHRQQMPWILAGLRVSLFARAVLRPRRRSAYRKAIGSIYQSDH